jgi:hypothetical protein
VVVHVIVCVSVVVIVNVGGFLAAALGPLESAFIRDLQKDINFYQHFCSSFRSLTQYQSFELVDTPVIRANEGNEASVAGKSLFYYTIRLGRVGVTSAPDAAKSTGETKHQIRIDDLSIQFEVPRTAGEMGHEKIAYSNAGVRTDVVLADGETIVLGASQIRQDAKEAGDALISILTAKVIR